MVLLKISGSHFIFEVNLASNTVSSYQVSTSGTSATKIGSYSTESGCGPISLTSNPGNTVIYVGCQDGGIDTYTINSNGSLTPLQAPAYTAGSNYDIESMAVDSTDSYLVVNAGINTTQSEFLLLTIGGGGALTLKASQTGFTGWAPVLVQDPVTTHGNYYYAGGTSDSNYFTITATSSSISVTANSASVEEVFPVWIDPTGTWLSMLYSAPNTPTSTSMQQYTISSSGSLSANGSEVSVNSQGTVSSSLGGYDSTSGFVIVRAESNILVFGYNSFNGSLTLKNSGLGGNEGFAYFQID